MLCCYWTIGTTLHYKFVLIWLPTVVFLHLMWRMADPNEVKWPLRGGYLGVMTRGSWTQLVPETRWRRWGDGTALLSTCRLQDSSWYQGAPAVWHHGNQRAPHWLAKLLQISTSDSLIESLAYKEVSWGHTGEVIWGFPCSAPRSSIMTTEHLYGVPEHGQQGACSVSHLSPPPAGYRGSAGRMGQCLGGHRWCLWDHLGDSAPG